ncbi:MAG: hypothetical protein L3J70_11750 [Gammaproteobacteria bacterium]|nr:hypothetical protein [Gammaproteobacteria bacterium]
MGQGFSIKEPKAVYNTIFGAKKDDLTIQNTFFWNQSLVDLAGYGGPTL